MAYFRKGDARLGDKVELALELVFSLATELQPS
jgi:hypothetical protein